jgi:hypothetical protein
VTDRTPPPVPEEPPELPARSALPAPPVPPAPPVLAVAAEETTAVRRSRRGVAIGVVAVLVAVVAAGGIGYAVLRPDGGAKDAKPAVTPWSAPTPTATKAFGAKSGGSHYGSLGLLLLPVPGGYDPGPDVDQFGNDVVLDAKQAGTLVRGDVSDLSKKDRKEVDQDIEDLRIEGAGLRTYTRQDSELVVQMEIVQMRNKQAASAETKFFGAFAKALGGFRNGPAVKGYADATCVLPPTEPGEKLDMMMCQATEGDLMVKMTVSGTAPLEKDEAVRLLAKQLDRIKDPGEAV